MGDTATVQCAIKIHSCDICHFFQYSSPVCALSPHVTLNATETTAIIGAVCVILR